MLSNANFDDLNNLYYDSHPWNDKEIYFNDYIYVSNLEKKIRLKVANIFKEKLKFEKKDIFWEIILFPWLYYFLSFIRSRYVLIEELTKKNFFLPFLPIYNLEDWTPRNVNEFLGFIKGEDFSVIIYSELLKKKFEFVEEKINVKKKYYKKEKIKSRKIKIINFFQKKKN